MLEDTVVVWHFSLIKNQLHKLLECTGKKIILIRPSPELIAKKSKEGLKQVKMSLIFAVAIAETD
ncbi:hypothetical protein HAX54_003021, partial [Datura stramonium]|nr:hypothetical protein [Datura stramonium]